MESIEQRLERLEYYQTLFLQFVEASKFPFFHLVMTSRLSEQEVNEITSVCDELLEQHKQQKAEGFVCFSPLLMKFEKHLPSKVSVFDTIDALHKQQLYVPLMVEFKMILKSGLSRK